MENFKEVSIRGRVAFAILCLENAIFHFGFDKYDWSFILGQLWSVTNSKLGTWHYPLSECTGRSIINDEDNIDDLEFLTKERFWELNSLYKKSNSSILRIIDLIFEIATRDLYASIVNNSPDTLEYLKQIILILEKENITFPDYKLVEKFSINEDGGWGRKFSREVIVK